MDMFVRLSDSKACDLGGSHFSRGSGGICGVSLSSASTVSLHKADWMYLFHLFYREMSNAEICIICVCVGYKE